MRLLSKTEARSKIKKDNDALIDSNIRLRKFYEGITHKLNTVRENYEPEKVAALKEFEQFVKDIQNKKSVLLQELQGIQKLVSDTKEMYYALVEKQDALIEKEYHIDEENKKLNLREAFVVDLEEKWRNKQ